MKPRGHGQRAGHDSTTARELLRSFAQSQSTHLVVALRMARAAEMFPSIRAD